MQKEITSQDTAYVLVYFKREKFKEFQDIDVKIPKEWFSRRRKNKESEMVREEQGNYQVEVVVAEFTGDFNLFRADQTIPMALKPSEDAVIQLKNFNGSFLGCKVGSVWKVHKNDKKVKKLI